LQSQIKAIIPDACIDESVEALLKQYKHNLDAVLTHMFERGYKKVEVVKTTEQEVKKKFTKFTSCSLNSCSLKFLMLVQLILAHFILGYLNML
jgi:hypothetical protein